MRATVVGSLIATTLSGAACHVMRPVTLDQLGAMRPARVWVTRADQSVVVVFTPRMFGDTLVGYVNGEFEELPATDLKQMQWKQPVLGKTVALIAAGAVGSATVAYLITSTGSYLDPASLLDCEDDPDQRGCPGANP